LLTSGITNNNIKVEAQVEEKIDYFTLKGIKLEMFGNNLLLKVKFTHDIALIDFE
jgi:hypothetical protein